MCGAYPGSGERTATDRPRVRSSRGMTRTDPRIVVGASSTAALALLWLVTRWSALVESTYASGLGPAVSRWLTAISARTPISLAEGLVGLVIVAVVTWGCFGVRRIARHGRTAIAQLAAEAWATLASVALLFLLVWGIGYARPPLEQRMGWDAAPPLDHATLTHLGGQLVDHVNGLYVALHGSPDGGAPTAHDGLPPDTDAHLDAAWDAAGPTLAIPSEHLFPRGPVKPLMSAPLVSLFGLAGIYFPFTGEANVNAAMPAWQQPHTRAHEMAHQRLINHETDANFAGFLVCISSDDLLVRYSGWLFAQRQVLRSLQTMDSEGAAVLIHRRHPGVQRDVVFAHRWWGQWKGPARTVATQVNNAYLQSVGVTEGVQAYGRSVRLVARWLQTCPTVAACDPVEAAATRVP